MSRSTFFATLVTLLVPLAACGGHPHLHESYGRSNQAAFAAQRIDPQPAQGSPAGLDSEEAALIHGSYRHTLGAPRSKAAEPSAKVLLIEETDKNARRSP
jgi:hypothetical protein